MNDDEVLVIGHRNPDADAICAAIGYAEFKRRTGLPNAVAARCGEVVERVKKVLDLFGVPPPRFVGDVAPRIRDVMERKIVHLTTDATLRDALDLMSERDIRVLPVLRPDRTFEGFLSIFKMCQLLSPSPSPGICTSRVTVSLNQVVRTLGATAPVLVNPEPEEDLTVVVAAMDAQAFQRRLQEHPPSEMIVLVGDEKAIQDLAVANRVRALVVTGGQAVREPLVSRARELGVSLLLSPHDTTSTAVLCRSAVGIDRLVHQHYESFREDDLISEKQSVAASSAFHAFPVLNAQRQAVGILSKSDFLKKVRRRLILVDHNELSQAVQGADQVEILEIIDHHRLGIMSTRQPILFRNEPVGSTSTLVADCFFRNGVELPPPIAGLLMAGLVSDTLNLHSPTATPRDAQILRQLEERCGMKADVLMEILFASGSLLASKAPAEAILADCKEFKEAGRSFSIAQIEEMGFDRFWKCETELRDALERHRADHNFFFAALFVTDVVKQDSILLVAGPENFLRQVDYRVIHPGVFEMPGVVSRKLQLLPFLTECLARLGEARPRRQEPVTMV